MANIEYKRFEIKSFDEYKGELKGYGVVYNKKDRVNDIILNDALQNSIDNFNVGVPIKFLFDHENAIELNTNIESISSDDVGALIFAKVSEEAKLKFPLQFKRMVQAFKNGNAYFSVGYYTVKAYILQEGKKVYVTREEWVKHRKNNPNAVRYLEEIKVTEFSFVTNPANLDAQVLDFKSINIPKYPIELSSSWDVDIANRRWREYSNSMEEPSEMYKKAFLYYNESEPLNFDSYYLQVVDVVGGEPIINDKAVIAVYQSIQGARGGFKIVPESEMPSLMSAIKELYSKMNNIRNQDGIELLEEPNFKMYEVEQKINNIHTKAFAEKFCRQYKKYMCNMSEAQFKKFINNITNIGYKVAKTEYEKKLDIEIKNAQSVNNSGFPSCETRSTSDTVQGQQIDLSKVANLLK